MSKYIFVLLLAPRLVLAQVEQATITGIVTDPTGALIPAAQITITNVRTGVAAETQTNEEGQYRVPYLPPGAYEIRVAKEGFSTAVQIITLSVGSTVTADVALTFGELNEVVTVTETIEMLERQSASLGNVITSRQLLELPLSGRNPYALVTLAPGVLPAGGSGTGPIISGGRSNTSEVLLDGAETRNSTTNDLNYTPPLEAVQEFKTITNSFSAEYGRSGGGVLTAATRSGTNDLHGSIYEFLRNEKLNANSWTTNRNDLPDPRTGKAPRSPFKRNEYGFAIGGPIYVPHTYDGRNKTFFFVNWEQTKQRAPDNLVATVPTTLERRGDFSQTFDGSGRLITIYDPATTRPDPNRPGRFIRDAFPNNQIPDRRIDPIVRRLLEFYPLPNRATRTDNFFFPGSRKQDSSRLFLRLDQAVGTTHRFFFTYGRNAQSDFTAGINAAYPGEGTNGERGRIERHPRIAVLSDTVTFARNLIGEFRASISRNVVSTQPRSAGYDFTQLGIAPGVKSQVRTLIFPRINVTDVTGAAMGPDRASFFKDAETAEEAQGHITWLHRNHSVKTGFDVAFMAFNVFRSERPSGSYDFSRTFTQGPDPLSSGGTVGHGVATLLLGAPTGGQITLDATLAASQRFYNWYVQDDWKLSSNVTLNLGVRWEYQTPWSDRFDQLAFFDPAATEPLTGQKGVLRFVGRDANSRYQSDSDKNNWGPRLGLAWRFLQDTVVRVGYGLDFFPGSGGIGAGASDLGSGFLATTSTFFGPPLEAPNTPIPGSSLADPFKAGVRIPPSTGVGEGINTAFREWLTPSIHHWNLNFQRTLAKDLLAEVAYSGSRGMHIWVNRERNAVSSNYLGLGPALDELVANPFFNKIPGGIGSSDRVRRSQLLRPFSHYTGIGRFRDAVGDSTYHAFTARVEKRTDHGLLFQGAYTFSKNLSNVQERFQGRGANFFDPNNLRLSRSITENDRPQRFVVNSVYELPFGRGKNWLNQGWMGRLLGNWQISGIGTFQSGLPVVISGGGATGLPGVNAAADRFKSPALPGNQRTLDRWFDTTAFAVSQPYTLGTDSRTEPNLRGPGTTRFDIGLSRTQRVREGVNIQLRAEFFNAFNTPQMGEPNGSAPSRDFGRITTGSSPREIQLGLRISY